MAVEVNEADERRFVELNSLPRGDFVQRVVNVWQMIRGDVADERGHDFVVAHAAMQPAKKHYELHTDGKDSGQNANPVGGHREFPLNTKTKSRFRVAELLGMTRTGLFKLGSSRILTLRFAHDKSDALRMTAANSGL